MKKIIIAMAAISAAFTMASCNKELVEPENNPIYGNCIITASTESSLTKTALKGDDEKGYEVVWSEGDSFKIRDNTFTLIKGAGTTSGIFQGYVSPGNYNATAFYPASYDGSNWPTEQTYAEGNGITGSPMKADVFCSGGNIHSGNVAFKNVGGILRLTLKGTDKIKSIKVFIPNSTCITLNCDDGVDLDNTNGTVFHIAMPPGTYKGTIIEFIASDDKCCIKTLKSDKPLVINRSEITSATIKVDNFKRYPTDGALKEPFTVADDGNGNVKKVYFSKGNLYWDGNSYEFEDNQYDYDVSGHHSSFCWSNSADLARGSEWSLDPNGSVTFFTNADENTASQDFIANRQTGIWRALSKNEWDYLISRDNGIGKATINGVNGLVIFYDGYAGLTDGLTSIPEGCVFLPASGENARYWSSTPYLESYIPGAECLHLEFRDGDVWPSMIPAGMAGRYFVRLVTEFSNEIPTPSFTVTFDMNGKTGTSPDNIVGVPYLSKIIKPSNPIASDSNYQFRGWYKEASCINEWDFDNDKVTFNTTLYAKWVTNINGHDCVKLAGKYWATEDVDECGIEATAGPDADYNAWGYYYYSQDYGSAMAAAASWGSTWKLPSCADWKELLKDENCEWIWMSSYPYKGLNVPGMIVTGKLAGEIGHSIFLPAAGLYVHIDGSIQYQGEFGYYWTSDFQTEFLFNDFHTIISSTENPFDSISADGLRVRPVSE